MNNIAITMETSAGKTVNRTIDISTFSVSQGDQSFITTCPERQHELLMNWIAERGNDQHDTNLSLISWYTH